MAAEASTFDLGLSDLRLLFLAGSALLAGAVNSLAGGGTLLTFPALASVMDGVRANCTSTVALLPGSLAGAWGYRRELSATWPTMRTLFWPSFAGGLAGSVLLVVLPGSVFDRLVPWLVLLAAVLLAAQPAISARLSRHGGPAVPLAGAVVLQFLVGLYGGYFGAGIGIMMLALLGLLGLDDIHRMNSVKTLLAAVINGISVVVFVIQSQIVWPVAAVMAVAAILGGYLGAAVSRRFDKNAVRVLVVCIGFAVAGYYFWKQLAAG
jgi:uncharacterized membrane protein YfcA